VLFDLRSRGRRRTVQATYLGLAVLMGGGLVLFGVGTGVGGGGLLNGLGGGGGGSQKPVVSQAEKSALRATQLRPNDQHAWSDLITARDATAKQDYNPATSTFTAAGRKELAAETQAWQRYLQLTKQPDSTLAILAARAYGAVGDFAPAASAWQIVTLANPSQVNAFECLAASAYAAHQTHLGDLASTKAIGLVPKVRQFEIKQVLTQAKTQPQVAQQC